MAGKQARRWWVRRWATAVAAAGLAVGPAAAQPAAPSLDPIERARRMSQVADQRADADIRAAVADADRIAKVYPSQAAGRLKAALLGLDTSVAVGPAKRRELADLLQSRIAQYEGRPVAAAVTSPAADPKAVKLRAEAAAEARAAALQAKDVQENVAEIEKLQGIGRTAAANARIAALLQKYPDNAAVQALAVSGATAQAVADAKKLASDSGKATLVALNQVQESAIPATRDVTFPQNWAELTKMREEKNGLGPEEEAILKALEKQVTQPLANAPFLESVQTLSNLVGKEIYLDKKSLEDAGLDLQRPVNVPGNVTARTALRAVLQAQGLTFVVKDKILQVVTLDKARDLQLTRAYYLGDLIAMAGPFGGAVNWGPAIDYQQTLSNAQVIVDSIKMSIDPLIWKDKGGPATAVFHAPTLSLIVRAPAEVHADLSRSRRR